MINSIKLRTKFKINCKNHDEYVNCIHDLVKNEMICSMDSFIQHSNTTCLEHCIYVSYISYVICRRLGLDYCSAARGGLLHDFFLYDWHIKKHHKGLHGFTHPYTALKNANKFFHLNDLEKDIIVKHMWPLTVRVPKYKETFIVLLVDKYCALMETNKFNSKANIYRLKRVVFQYK